MAEMKLKNIYFINSICYTKLSSQGAVVSESKLVRSSVVVLECFHAAVFLSHHKLKFQF